MQSGLPALPGPSVITDRDDQLITPQAMRLPALPVFAVSVVASAALGVYWLAAAPTGTLPRLSAPACRMTARPFTSAGVKRSVKKLDAALPPADTNSGGMSPA